MVWEGSACEGALYPIPAPERSGMICRSNFARVLRMSNDLFGGELLPPDAKSKPASRKASTKSWGRLTCWERERRFAPHSNSIARIR